MTKWFISLLGAKAGKGRIGTEVSSEASDFPYLVASKYVYSIEYVETGAVASKPSSLDVPLVVKELL